MANTTETRRSDRRQAEAEAMRREAPRLSADPAPVKGRPANENDPGTAMLLAKMRRRPSFTPYALVSIILTAVWSSGWFFRQCRDPGRARSGQCHAAGDCPPPRSDRGHLARRLYAVARR